MKWKFSLPKPQIFVYYYAKLIGLAPFTVRKNKFYPPNCLGKLYLASIAAIYSVITLLALYSIAEENDRKNIPRSARFAGNIGHSINFLSTFLTRIIFLFMYKEIVYIMNKLRFISNELKSLGIEKDQGKIFKTVLVRTAMANTTIILASLTLGFTEVYWPILSSIKYGFDDWFQANTILIFIQILIFIKECFKLVNEMLYNVFKPVGVQNSQIFVVSGNTREVNQPTIEDLTDVERIRIIELLHLELCDLVYLTTHLFASPILLKCLHFCTELTTYSFWLYSVVQNFDQLNSNVGIVTIMISLFNCLLKTAILIGQLFIMAYTSVTTCREGNATKTVLSNVWRKPNSQKLEDEFFLFSLQLQHKRLTVSAFGFLDLDYSLLYKIFCTAVASTIVIVQFDMSQQNLGT